MKHWHGTNAPDFLKIRWRPRRQKTWPPKFAGTDWPNDASAGSRASSTSKMHFHVT